MERSVGPTGRDVLGQLGEVCWAKVISKAKVISSFCHNIIRYFVKVG